METTDKKLNLEQIFAAAIKQSIGEKLVISPKSVAEINQNSRIVMSLDEKGNFVLTVKEKLHWHIKKQQMNIMENLPINKLFR